MNEPRPYHDERDLECHAQPAGVEGARQTMALITSTRGDLNWWLYYPPLEGDYWNAYLPVG